MAKTSTFSIVSIILGALFWIPIIGYFLSSLALIFGIHIKKTRPEESGCAWAAIILGLIGIIFPFICLVILQKFLPETFLMLENYGIFDVMSPLAEIMWLLFFLVFALMHLTKQDVFTKAMYAIVIAFIGGIAAAIPHILGTYPVEWDVIMILNQSIYPVLIASVVAVFAFSSLIFIQSKKMFYWLFFGISILVTIIFTPWLLIMLFYAPFVILFYIHKDEIHPIIMRIFAILGTIITFIILLASIITDSRYYLPRTEIIIIYILAILGIIGWIYMLIKIGKKNN